MIDERFCFICQREARGFAFQSPSHSDAPLRTACSMECMDLLKDVSIMPHLTDIEKLARRAAGIDGGKYLESLGKYDLAVLTPEEYGHFVEHIFNGYQFEMRRLVKDIVNVPF